MTQQIAPYILMGMDALLLVSGIWLLAHAVKTWRTERLKKIEATDYTDKAA